jgi:hypothetical protein
MLRTPKNCKPLLNDGSENEDRRKERAIAGSEVLIIMQRQKKVEAKLQER